MCKGHFDSLHSVEYLLKALFKGLSICIFRLEHIQQVLDRKKIFSRVSVDRKVVTGVEYFKPYALFSKSLDVFNASCSMIHLLKIVGNKNLLYHIFFSIYSTYNFL